MSTEDDPRSGSGFLWPFVAILLTDSLLSSWVVAGEIDVDTQGRLAQIISEHRANRLEIHDLYMAGTVDTVNGLGDVEHIDFRYWQLGEKRRIDHSYSEVEAFDTFTAGRTILRAMDGESTLSFFEGYGLAAAIEPPGEFASRSKLAYLDNLVISKKWDDSVGHIKYLLERGWQPKKESIALETVNVDGEPLLMIRYESRRGGFTVHEWVIDPARGFEVVSAKNSAEYGFSGKPWLTQEVDFEVIEVAPGIWRSAGVRHHTVEVGEDGSEIGESLVVITTDEFEANTGQIEDEIFTLKGMGIPIGHPVVDSKVEPQLEYTFGRTNGEAIDLDDLVTGRDGSEPRSASDNAGTNDKLLDVNSVSPGNSTQYYDLDRANPGYLILGIIFIFAFVSSVLWLRGSGKGVE